MSLQNQAKQILKWLGVAVEANLRENECSWKGIMCFSVAFDYCSAFCSDQQNLLFFLTVSKGICFEAKMPVLVWMGIRSSIKRGRFCNYL